MLVHQLNLLEKEMINLRVLLPKRTHSFNTGIDRYANEISAFLKKRNDIVINESYIPKSSKFDVLKNLFFGTKKKIVLNDEIVHLVAPLDLSCFKVKGRLVTTIHDLCPLIIPQAYPFYMPYIFKRNIKNLIKNNSCFITNSNCTKNDLMFFFKVPEERIWVTPLGVSDNFLKPNVTTIEKKLTAYKISGDYFLFTGAMNKRKNLKTTIEAFIKFKERTNSKVKLVLAGRMNWGGSQIEKLLKNNNLQDEVILPGYIEDQDLPAVISGARAVLYLSLYEGFGFPALEAMKVGTPIIASNTSSIPEVVEDAGLLVNPLDLKEIVNAMSEISSNAEIRNQYIQKGIKQAEKFSWEKTAKKTLEAYKNIIALNSNEKS
jgi:glycosyltransferase involved in cell wall biosynthesis